MKKKKLKKIYKTFNKMQAVGLDGTTKEKFDESLSDELSIIKRKIENESYDFSYYRQKLIIKSENKTREISIPTLRDKLVHKYLYKYIQKKFHNEINLIPSVHTMINDIITTKENFDFYIKIDIQNFFPSINHEILVKKLKKKINSSRIIGLIEKAITQTTVDVNTPSKERIKYNNKCGVPQGLSISGLLAEIYMAKLMKKYTANQGIKTYRFVDDMLILCSRKDSAKLMTQLQKDFNKLKVSIHEFKRNSHKSSYGDMDERFEFLGYVFHNNIVSVRDSSSNKMFINLSKLFSSYKHNKYVSSDEFYFRINLKITGCIIDNKRYGWIHFFSFINDFTLLNTLDRFIEKTCHKLKLDNSRIKKFSKAIFEIKNPKSSYIPKSLKNKFSIKAIDLQFNLENDVEFY